MNFKLKGLRAFWPICHVTKARVTKRQITEHCHKRGHVTVNRCDPAPANDTPFTHVTREITDRYQAVENDVITQ